VYGAAGLAGGPVRWTELWIARAQHKADLRAERFRRHEEGVRTGSESPNLLDRMASRTALFHERLETSGLLLQAYANERVINGHWPLGARPDDTPALAEQWRTWVTDGPVRGPDGVTVVIWVRSAGRDLPFRDFPADQTPVTWQELAARQTAYTVCVRRMPGGPALRFCSFATETSARWYAVELARTVRQAGITGLRPSDILPERPRPARSEHALASDLTGGSRRPGRHPPRLPHRARTLWRQIRTSRQ